MVAALAVPQSNSARSAHWGYNSENGPSNWPKPAVEYVACGVSQSHSPVNLTESSVNSKSVFNIFYLPA